jgi:hypothetical protein
MSEKVITALKTLKERISQVEKSQTKLSETDTRQGVEY